MRDTPTVTRIAVNGLTLAVWEWTGAGETLFFVHANGFHARCWDQVIALLPDYRCLALDLRGHGRSDPAPPPSDWRMMGEDVAAITRALRVPSGWLRGVTAIGHSIGGYAVTLAAALEPEAFARLVLIDPVIMPPERYVGVREGEHFAARRRAHWPSPEAMIARFADRPPFNAWDPRVLRDYCQYGLLPAEDGYVLACAPAFEASLYQVSTAPASNIYPEIARITQPTLVVRPTAAERGEGGGFSASPAAPDLAERFVHGRAARDPEHTHFLPMESPAKAAAYIRSMLDDGPPAD